MLKRWLCLAFVLALVTGACSDDKDKVDRDGCGADQWGGDVIDALGGADAVDTSDSVGGVDSVDAGETVDGVDTLDTVDSADPVDTVDTIDTIDTIDTAQDVCGCGQRVCGDDGCGTDCGTCDEGLTCTPFGQCLSSEVPANDTCAAPVELIFKEAWVATAWGSTEYGTNDYSAFCGGGEAPDLAYKFNVPAGTPMLTIKLVTEHDPVLYLANGTCGTTSLLTCVSGKKYSLLYPSPGDFYIIVDGKTAADKGEFYLTVTFE
jgi:hypothetical protein